MKNLTKLTALTLTAALALTACGSSAAATAPAAESAAGSTAEAASGDLLSEIQAKGTITVAMEGTWAPWTYHDENDNLVGYDVEVATEIAKKLGVEPQFVEGEWDGLLAGLDAGRYDIMVNGVDITPERAEKYDFSTPYAFNRTAVITKADDDSINTLEDLKGKKTANTISSTYAELAEQYGAAVTGVDDLNQTFELLLSGRIDATLGIAFSFKLQTVFVLPLWGGLWLLRRVRFRELLWFPAAYAATCVPALLLGKPLGDILGVYFGQAAEYSGYLNLNAPNVYALIPHGAEVNTALAARLGILAAFALAAAVLAALLVFRRQADDRALLAAAVVLAIGVPFLLPHMHERYFFLADVLALAWACAFPRSAPCALLVELASLGAYVVVLRGKFTLAVSLDGRLFPMLCEALLMLAGLAFAVLSLARRLAFPQKSRE